MFSLKRIINDFLIESKFNLEEIPNSNKFILRKNEENFKVEVLCNSRAPILNNQENEENCKKNFFIIFYFLFSGK